MFCKNCGTQIADGAGFCPSCGTPTDGNGFNDFSTVSRKSRLVALLLCWFLGGFGAHRLYVGRIASAILMLLTCGGLGIWWLIDLLVVLCGDFKDDSGRKLLNWLDR